MKIGILTHYRVYNQGARLQLAAMEHYLRNLGHTPVVLTYEKNFDFDAAEQKKNSASFKALPYYIKHYLMEKGIGLTFYNFRKVRSMDAYSTRFTYEPYDSADLDAVIIGSDEVFSIDVGCNQMMYGYGLKAPAIAYAPSFGRTTEEILRQYGVYYLVRDGLRHLNRLSARDTHTQQMIFNLTGQMAPLVCDPVILYDGYGFETEDRRPERPYLLVYSYDSNMTDPSEVEAIKRYAKKHRLITVSAGTYHGWCDKNVVCSPEQWIGWFRNAACVVTDTFHGSVVAIKNHCNTAVFVREKINTYKLQSLLEETGLQHRRLPELTEAHLERVLSQKTDYTAVDAKLERMAENGRKYLANALEGLHAE